MGGPADGRKGVGIDRHDRHWTIDEAVGVPVQTSAGPESKAWHAEAVDTVAEHLRVKFLVNACIL